MPRRLVLSLEPTLLKLKLVSPKGTITLVSIALLKAILRIFFTGTYTKSVSSMKMLWKVHKKRKKNFSLVASTRLRDRTLICRCEPVFIYLRIHILSTGKQVFVAQPLNKNSFMNLHFSRCAVVIVADVQRSPTKKSTASYVDCLKPEGTLTGRNINRKEH